MKMNRDLSVERARALFDYDPLTGALRWRARGPQLGLFDTLEEAAGAYCAAAVKYFGEFAAWRSR